MAVLAGTVLGPVGAARAGEPLGGPALGSRGVVVRAAPGVPPIPAGLAASAWLVADLGTGAVLAARDPHGRYAPASTLKILTALALIPRLAPARPVVVSQAAAAVAGSRAGLVPGQRLRVDQLFSALLVVSANDAAVALGEAAGGATPALRLLNAEAARLQASDTVAKTLDGLDAPGQHTSAYDLALISRAALALPAFRRYVGTEVGYLPAPGGRRYQIASHNRLLGVYPGLFGVKNGYTSRAGASYVGVAKRNGRTILVSLLHAEPTVWRDAAKLLDWGFAADGRVAPAGQLVGPLPAQGDSGRGAPRRAGIGTGAGRLAGPGTGGPAGGFLVATGLIGLFALGQRRRVVLARRVAARRAARRG